MLLNACSQACFSKLHKQETEYWEVALLHYMDSTNKAIHVEFMYMW